MTKSPIHCPSTSNDVISVGNMITTCPSSPGEESTDEKRGLYFGINDEDDLPANTKSDMGAYCGERGCVDGERCITSQEELPQDRNAMSTGDKPDVLAPKYVLGQFNDERFLNDGTSFATPLVTGSLICILANY